MCAGALVNARMEQGGYTAVFQRLRLPDGRYRCQLTAGSRIISEKLILTGRGTTVASTAGVTVASGGSSGGAAAVERKSFRLPGGGGHTTAKP